MKYGNKRQYRGSVCGQTTYFKGEPKDRPHVDCPSGKPCVWEDIELRMKCPHCKNTIKRESTDSKWKCKACGHTELV